MEIKLRPFSFDDIDEILKIINFYILNTTSVYDYEERTYEQQKNILEEKVAKNFPFFIAEVDGKVSGFGTYGDFRFKKGYQFTVEHSIYIDKDFHGLGIGKILLEALMAEAKKQKIHTMIAVIDTENQISVDLHKKYGFQSVGVLNQVSYKFDRWLSTDMLQIIF
jgi:L-amino acid N-acyltransferase